MRHNIIAETINELWDDTKFIRLSTVTMFIHSLIFTILIIWYSHYFIDNAIVSQFVWLFQEMMSVEWWRFWPLLILWVILAIWYWILPPIWEASMLIYKHEWRQQWTTSLSKWFGKFFPMFEFHAATWLFHVHVVLFAILRMYAINIIDSWLIKVLLVIWILLTIFVAIFFSYWKMFIVLEWEKFFSAMTKSASLAMNNIKITTKFAFLTLALTIRFVINIVVLVWIPLGIIYAWTRMWLDNILFLKISFICIMLLLIFLVSYVEWIIEAFFITCWWKVWNKIKHEDWIIDWVSEMN